MNSPTTLLQLHFCSLESEDGYVYDEFGQHPRREIGLGLHCTVVSFSSKRRREAFLDRSQSLDSYFIFTGDTYQVKKKRRKKRYEEWDAKEGVNIKNNLASSKVHSKALTDITMAHDMGVELDFIDGVIDSKERNATTSPMDPKDIC